MGDGAAQERALDDSLQGRLHGRQAAEITIRKICKLKHRSMFGKRVSDSQGTCVCKVFLKILLNDQDISICVRLDECPRHEWEHLLEMHIHFGYY